MMILYHHPSDILLGTPFFFLKIFENHKQVIESQQPKAVEVVQCAKEFNTERLRLCNMEKKWFCCQKFFIYT